MNRKKQIFEIFDACTAKGGSVYGSENVEKLSSQHFVLMVSHELSLTGAPVVLKELAVLLMKLNKQPIILSPVDGPLRNTFVSNGIPVLICPRSDIDELVTETIPLFDMLVINTIVCASVVSALNGGNVPVLWWIHEAELAYDPFYLEKMPEQLYPNVKVVVAGPLAKAHLLKYRPEYEAEELLYCIDDEAAVNTEFKLPQTANDKMLFSLVGSVERRKGQDILLDAIRLLPEDIASACYFIFVGNNLDAAFTRKITDNAENEPDKILYLPSIDRESMPGFYKTIDCLICASRDDPMPVVVTEMLMHSGDVICSENTGSAKLLEKYDAGLVYHRDSAEELAATIEAYVKKHKKGPDHANSNGRLIFEQYFCPERFLLRVSSLIEDLEIESRLFITNKMSKQIYKLEFELSEKNKDINYLNKKLVKKNKAYKRISNSYYWRMTAPLRAVSGLAKDVLRQYDPLVTGWRNLKSVKKPGLRKAFNHNRNQQKLLKNGPLFTQRELAEQRKHVFPKTIKFSILVPLYNTKSVYLREMLQSVIDQTYSNWELCISDGSDLEHGDVELICREYQRLDSRIKYRRLKKNLGISGNTNACFDMVSGDYIGLLDHDDILHPAALYEVMRAICIQDADFIYTDENTFHNSPEDAYCPHYKPDYAPDTLRGCNYICHFTVAKKELFDAVGHYRSEYNGSQDYDMVLRLTEKATNIVHIPEILYYWRAHPGSVAESIDAKSYAVDAAKRALEAHLERVQLSGQVLDSSVASMYRIRYELKANPLVSIIIPNCEHYYDLKNCLDSLYENTSYSNFEVIIIENNSKSLQIFDYYKSIQIKWDNLRVVEWDKQFNYSAINNYGVSYAHGEYLLLLNNDIEIISSDWIQEMLMFAQREDVGAVGAKLYYPDNSIQHAGVGLGIGGVAGHYFVRLDRSDPGYMGRLIIAQNLSAVTGACVMLRRSIWDEVGGLDEGYAVAFNDVDLCMKIRKAGYLIIWTPFAELYHYESKSRGLEDTPEKLARFDSETQRFQKKWARELAIGDMYFNPNFSLTTVYFDIIPPRMAREKIRKKEETLNAEAE